MSGDLDKEMSEAHEALLDAASSSVTDEALVCECYCVSVGDIRANCSSRIDVPLLEERFGFGVGCKSCLKDLPHWQALIFGHTSEGA